MTKHWLSLFVLSGLVLLAAGSGDSRGGAGNAAQAPAAPGLKTKNDAYVGCQAMITNRLKAPSTAIFPRFGFEDHVRETASQAFRVESYVDSQNSFGAMLRMPWQCEVTFVNGEPRNVKLWLDGVPQG